MNKIHVKVGTWGAFDYVIHEGHLTLLTEARKLGDYLYVFVVSDDIIIKNKKRLPIYPAKQRASNLINTGLVDDTVILLSEDYVHNVEEQILSCRLDRYIFGCDQTSLADKYLEKRLCDFGVEIFVSKSPMIIHTTEILRMEGLIK